MNYPVRYQPSNSRASNSNSGCAELVTTAERELSALLTAVTELYGPEQAKLSAEDWLRELNENAAIPASIRDWRLITAKVSLRLASRVGAKSLSPEPQIA